MARRLTALLLGVAAAASPAAAQAPDDTTRLEPVVVTVTRMEQKADEAPASVTVLTRDDIEHSVAQTLDDLLRQVPGFSLFRRSSSLVTHPTTQGVSLRGIGPSGASRALVLVDGVPANDAFGGWVYWGRIPMLGVEQIEVVRGGGSSVWGNYALGGVVQVLTRRPTERALFFDASYGTQDTMNFDLLLHDVEGPFRISLEGNYFSTGGYDVVKRRGSIDIEADSNHSTFNGRVELLATPDASFFVSGFYFYEERGNGTALQFNHTEPAAGRSAAASAHSTTANCASRSTPAENARRKRLTSPEPSTRLRATWLRVEFGADPKTQLTEVRAMAWEAPEFVEVRMDAEINSYQDEFGPGREEDDRF